MDEVITAFVPAGEGFSRASWQPGYAARSARKAAECGAAGKGREGRLRSGWALRVRPVLLPWSRFRIIRGLQVRSGAEVSAAGTGAARRSSQGGDCEPREGALPGSPAVSTRASPPEAAQASKWRGHVLAESNLEGKR